MKETIDTYSPTQKDRYVHKIIPIISLQIIAKQKAIATSIYFKSNSNLKVKRLRKQDESIINKRKITNINNSLYDINDNSRKPTHNITNDDHTSPYKINKITDSIIHLPKKTFETEPTNKLIIYIYKQN